MRCWLGWICCLSVVGVLNAGDIQVGKQRASKIAPYLDEQTVAVIYADLSTINVGKILNTLADDLPLPKEDMQKVQAKFERELSQMREAGIGEVYGVVNLADIPFDPGYLIIPVAQGKGDAVVKLVAKYSPGQTVKQVGNIVYMGTEQTAMHFRNNPPTGLVEAFSATADAEIQAVGIISDLLRKSISETAPQVPNELGGGRVTPYVEGFQWASVGLHLQPKVSANVVVQGKDADAAKAMHKLAARIYALAKKDFVKELPGMEFPEFLMPELNKDRLTLQVKQEQFVGPVAQAAAKMREAASRAQSSNNLKQIGLAMHNYHDTYRMFPPVANYKDKKPLLSWRVHVLPYVEQQELYTQFKLDEPWDSPHNKKLIARMPQVYRAPHSKAEPGKTVYLVPVGKKLAFVPGPKGQKIQAFTDGTSNTILGVEVDDAKAVIWTKPDDLTVDPKNPLNGLGKDRGFFNALFADGSVRVIANNVNADTLFALFTRGGGEVAQLD